MLSRKRGKIWPQVRFQPGNRISTTDEYRWTRIINALEDLLRVTQWVNDLKSIFIRVLRCPSVVFQIQLPSFGSKSNGLNGTVAAGQCRGSWLAQRILDGGG